MACGVNSNGRTVVLPPAHERMAMEALSAQPIAALVIGLVILIFPRVLNYAIAAYLIFIGVTGLWPDLL